MTSFDVIGQYLGFQIAVQTTELEDGRWTGDLVLMRHSGSRTLVRTCDAGAHETRELARQAALKLARHKIDQTESSTEH